MTAKQFIDELQRQIVKHPEAANWPVRFLGCDECEDRDGEMYNLPIELTVCKVRPSDREGTHYFTLDGH